MLWKKIGIKKTTLTNKQSGKQDKQNSFKRFVPFKQPQKIKKEDNNELNKLNKNQNYEIIFDSSNPINKISAIFDKKPLQYQKNKQTQYLYQKQRQNRKSLKYSSRISQISQLMQNSFIKQRRSRSSNTSQTKEHKTHKFKKSSYFMQHQSKTKQLSNNNTFQQLINQIVKLKKQLQYQKHVNHLYQRNIQQLKKQHQILSITVKQQINKAVQQCCKKINEIYFQKKLTQDFYNHNNKISTIGDQIYLNNSDKIASKQSQESVHNILNSINKIKQNILKRSNGYSLKPILMKYIQSNYNKCQQPSMANQILSSRKQLNNQ